MADRVSGSTLRRHLEHWAQIGLLPRAHAVLVSLLRGDPTLIVDTCSVRAKRGGDLTGPNPTDRGKQGTKYHIATTGNGVPVACAATAANVNDTMVFERLFLGAFAVLEDRVCAQGLLAPAIRGTRATSRTDRRRSWMCRAPKLP